MREWPSLTHPLRDEDIDRAKETVKKAGLDWVWSARIVDTLRSLGWDGGGYTRVIVTRVPSTFPRKGTVRFRRECDGHAFSLRLVGNRWKTRRVGK